MGRSRSTSILDLVVQLDLAVVDYCTTSNRSSVFEYSTKVIHHDAADVLAAAEKQLQANERLKAGLLTKRNDLVMTILGRDQAAPKPNYRAT